MGLGIVLAFLFAALVLNDGLNSRDRLSQILATCAAALVLGAVIFWLRAGIIVRPTHLEIRSLLFRIRRVAWGDVACFTFAPATALNGSVYVAVRLKDGRLLETGALVFASENSFRGLKILEVLESLRVQFTQGAI